MEFDVESQSLKCPNCETVVPILNETDRIVEHSLTRHAMQTIRAEEKTTQTMECRGCGAKIEIDPTSTAVECPYCGSDYVLAEKQEDAIIPDGVLPFQIDKDRVGELFRRWMKGRWLAPGELKHLYQRERLQGVYLPYWTFDAKADARYTAMGGRHRTVTRKGPDGKETRQIVTDWYPTSGFMRRAFDDVLVPASHKLDEGLLRRAGVFGTKQMASYSPEYFSGYGAECYTVDLEDAHREALQTMENVLASMARSDVLRRFDEVRNVRIRADYRDETYKHVMMPVYTTAYTYKGKQYHVLINGQSGRVEGDYPKSPAKIAAIVAAVLVIVALVYWFSGSGDRREAARVNEVWTMEACVGADDVTDNLYHLPEGGIYDEPDAGAAAVAGRAAWMTGELEDEEEVSWVYLADNLPT